MGCLQHVEHIDKNNRVAMFTHMYSSVISNPNVSYFTVEVASTQERPHFRLEILSKHNRDMSKQTFKNVSKFFVLLKEPPGGLWGLTLFISQIVMKQETLTRLP